MAREEAGEDIEGSWHDPEERERIADAVKKDLAGVAPEHLRRIYRVKKHLDGEVIRPS